MDSKQESLYCEMPFPVENLPENQLSVASSPKRSVVLESWIDASGHPALCVHQRFEAQVEQTPDAIALICEDQQFTYRQLNERANQVAHFLRRLGVGPDQLVGICVERSPSMVIGLLGILKAGGAYVPLDPDYPSDRLAFILDDTQVSILLTQQQHLEHLPTTQAKVVCLDSDWSEIAQERSANPNLDDLCPSHLMYVIYTSGSTGKPKGVMISHAGICNQLDWRKATFPLSERDRVLQNISFSFDPSVWQIFWTLTVGAQLVLPQPKGHQDSAYLIDLIATQQVSVIALVPSLLRVLLEEKTFDRCHALKHVFCGGEALTGDLQQRFFERFPSDVLLHNVYGPTEASIDATFWTCQPGTDFAVAPIGHPITNAQVYLLDSDLQTVELGTAGELHIGGAGLARGYLNRPDLTAEKFIPSSFSECDRLYKTGDLARYLPDGTIEFLGRIDHQVKIRGFRIELGEIESALGQHPAIQQAIVIDREDTPGAKRLIAYFVPTQTAPSSQELRAFLLETLPDYMIPAAFVSLEQFPLNANGKIDRRALPAPVEERSTASAYLAASNPLEEQLVAIWEKVLGVHPISVTDNFVELGGNSLLATQLVQQVEQQFDKRLPLLAVFQAPTIQELATLLQLEGADLSLLIPIQPLGHKTPVFGIHVLGKGLAFYRPMAKYLGPEQPIYGLSAYLSQDATADVKALAARYVKELRSFQPEGPYYLLGVSFGGVVVFEMAQLLHAQGQEVGLLGLLDAFAPGGVSDENRLPLRSRLAAYWKRARRLDPKELSFRIRRQIKIRSLRIPVVRSLSNWLYQTGTVSMPNDVRDMLYVQQNESATGRYVPDVYPGKVVLFKAKDQEISVALASDPRSGWQSLAGGGFEVHDIPGSHLGILQEPYVEFLAEQIKQYLD